MIIRVDFHVHSEYSFDGVMSLEKIVETAKLRGLDAVAVTDHDVFAGLRSDELLIIPGVEFTTTAGHVQALFLEREVDKKYLLRGGLGRAEIEPLLEGIKAAGGLSVAAHPFRGRNIYDESPEMLRLFDCIEIANARTRARDANERAEAAAKEYGKAVTAGSDAHIAGEIGGAYLTLEVEELTLLGIKKALLPGNGKAAWKAGPGIYSSMSQTVMALRKRNIKKILKLPLVYGKNICRDIKRAIGRD